MLQTSRLLDILPDRTLYWGNRGNYIFPVTPFNSYNGALNNMEGMLQGECELSKVPVVYPEYPPEVGSSPYGWKIFPYVKYNLKTGYTYIVKKLHISFDSFYKALYYLLNISTVTLPFYPLGFRLYSQYFFVFWSDYEEFLCTFFGCLPCHTSITKVNDALTMYVNIQKGEEMSEKIFQFYSKWLI